MKSGEYDLDDNEAGAAVVSCLEIDTGLVVRNIKALDRASSFFEIGGSTSQTQRDGQRGRRILHVCS